ncbi:MAG: hypothetical protein H7222_13960 [Methylotenera sp.]|nr:hypothetical protein [Oligoflexia bacterium]
MTLRSLAQTLMIAFFTLPLNSRAGTVEVHALKPGASLDEFANISAKVHSYESQHGTAGDLPFTAKKRNHWLQESGLSEVTKDWDALKRDELVLNAGVVSEGALTAKYPDLPPVRLRKLRRLRVRAARGSKS